VTTRSRLLVMTSTYPRWPDDHEPGFVHQLCKRLTGDFEVTVLCPHAAGAAVEEIMEGVQVRRYRYAPARLETLVNDGGIVTNLKRRSWKWLLVPGFVLAQAWMAWRLIRRLRPDAVHAHWLIPQGLLIALLGCIEHQTPPFLVTAHGADLYALKGRGATALKRFVVRRAFLVTVVSESMRKDLADLGADVSKVEVQSMGVDLSGRFTPEISVRRSRSEILFVGRLVEKKGLRYLIEAMRAVLREHPQACLTVAGFGPEEPALRSQVGKLGLADHVRFIGAVTQTDLPALYRRAAVFVAPFVKAQSGDQEGLGLVCIEAIGCGCPVIVSDLSTSRDMFAGASSVTYAPPADSSAMAQAIRNLLSAPDKYWKAAVADRQQLIKRFDWSAVSERYIRMLSRASSIAKQV
jgi:glycosyltransferase involved in cell wall biosynthesis